ncbi:hypothetical protein [Streptomyces sp. NPDC058373]|uniref:hypothetical protein n=1 Tax=Streptomyces sp. NPDC058373 TaxID=3346465 RepID=UPI0036640E98
MGMALAAAWRTIPELTRGSTAFGGGSYKWVPTGVNYGGSHFRGDLTDTSAGDGHNASVQAKAEGYSWNRFNGRQDKAVPDGAARYVRDTWIHVCRDRGSLCPDNCSPAMHDKR